MMLRLGVMNHISLIHAVCREDPSRMFPAVFQIVLTFILSGNNRKVFIHLMKVVKYALPKAMTPS